VIWDLGLRFGDLIPEFSLASFSTSRASLLLFLVKACGQ
jgi:hypothetical protein